MPTKSIFRQPGARHFQLVHRSQRDPLIHDPDASQHVLAPIERPNARKGKSRAGLDNDLDPSALPDDRIGQAALYGIYYDDTEYDYMQHLRPIGVREEGVESVMVERPPNPVSSKQCRAAFSLQDLPQEVLPSTSELPRTYESQEAIPSSIAGFKPDLDPHTRQTLEALEDDAFVDTGLEDDFFCELVAGGERREEVVFEFREEGVNEEAAEELETDQSNWEARYATFKNAQKNTAAESVFGGPSEGGDTVGRLPAIPVIGGKRRKKAASTASGYSMSSSSLFRTETLRTLDERFDHVMEKEYGYPPENECSESEHSEHSDGSEAPDLVTSSASFNALVDDFIENFEILGGKLRPKLDDDCGTSQFGTARLALREDAHVKIQDIGDDIAVDLVSLTMGEDKRDRWDCETILTTYTNLENHPRLILARNSKSSPRIHLNPKSGLPSVREQHIVKKERKADILPSQNPAKPKGTVNRPKDEPPEDKKARKHALKNERQARRKIKKATKEQFGTEALRQMGVFANSPMTVVKRL